MPSRFDSLGLAGAELPGEDLARLASPALVIHLDRVRENVRRVLAATGGRPGRWRPHLKTTKLPEVWDELLAAGLRHFKCATVREARVFLEWLERRGIGDADLLVGYPLTGPALALLGRAVAERPAGARVAVLVDCREALLELPAGVDAFVDVNVGMDRTGVPIADVERIVELARAAGDRLRGLHAYDGHLFGSTGERREAAFACYDRVLELAERVAGAVGRWPGELVTSGTPTFLQALEHPGLAALPAGAHRVSPGTVVFHDFRSEQTIAELDLVPAAVVLARVVSHPAPGVATCDAGSKAIAADAGDPVAHVLGWPGLEARRPSEEHLPLGARDGRLPERGAPLWLVPRHVCPTVNLAERAVLVDGGVVRGTARVAARGHDLWVEPAPGSALAVGDDEA